ncbi:MAG: glycosyltransferase family 4 protein [Balneolaceae bacterium]
MAGRKIGMVLNAFYPHDIRVSKEVSALTEAGHEVFLLCYKRNGEPSDERVDGANVKRVWIGESKIAEGLWDMVNACLFYHPRIGSALKSFVREFSIDVLHVHDLPLAGTVASVATKENLPWILDLHENYPEAVRVWFGWRKNLLIRLKNRIFFNPSYWQNLEGIAARSADGIIAVVEEMRERLAGLHSIPEEKIRVISNTESRQFLKQPLQENIYGDLSGSFLILYSGYIGPHRGVDTVIRAMEHLARFRDIHFVIVGTGSRDVMQNLNSLTQKLGVENQVHFKGFQPFDTFLSYMSGASLTVIPHKRNGHTDHTIPHKLFQSMMAGKPVLVSSCRPLRRTVEENRCGLVFEAEDPADCAEKILSLYKSDEMLKTVGENGRLATLEGTLNWESSSRELLQLYRSF